MLDMIDDAILAAVALGIVTAGVTLGILAAAGIRWVVGEVDYLAERFVRWLF